MKEMIVSTQFFGAVLSLGCYFIGMELKKKFKFGLFHPLLVSVILVMLILFVFDIDYEHYIIGGKYIGYLLTPTTICLAIPLYRQLELLKKNFLAVGLGVLSGVAASGVCIFVLSRVFQFENEIYVSMLPKSITTAIAVGVVQELGGITNITIVAVLITGIVGSVVAEGLCKVLRITEPIAKGLAMGTAAHAVGTSKALEIGEAEGAMSSLAIVVAGLMTVVIAPLMSGWI